MALEPKVGEIFELDGKKYECVKGEYCTDCIFLKANYKCLKLKCISSYRQDKTPVIFKLHTYELG